MQGFQKLFQVEISARMAVFPESVAEGLRLAYASFRVRASKSWAATSNLEPETILRLTLAIA